MTFNQITQGKLKISYHNDIPCQVNIDCGETFAVIRPFTDNGKLIVCLADNFVEIDKGDLARAVEILANLPQQTEVLCS